MMPAKVIPSPPFEVSTTVLEIASIGPSKVKPEYPVSANLQELWESSMLISGYGSFVELSLSFLEH